MILGIETLPYDLSIVVQKTKIRFFDKTKFYQNSEQLNISKSDDTITHIRWTTGVPRQPY